MHTHTHGLDKIYLVKAHTFKGRKEAQQNFVETNYTELKDKQINQKFSTFMQTCACITRKLNINFYAIQCAKK